MAVLLAAAGAFLAFKAYLRDGAKPISLLALGAVLGAGMACSRAFVPVLPSLLLPAMAAGGGRRRALRSLLLVAAAFLPFYFGIAALQAIDNVPESPRERLEQLRALASPSDSLSPAVDGFYLILFGIVLAAFLYGLISGQSRTGAAQAEGDPLAWRKPWRLAPLFNVAIGAGFLGAGLWVVWSSDPDWLLARPWLALVASTGLATITDWIRRRRSIGNIIAQHLVAYGLALHILANSVCLSRLAR
jgi:hypothetical protein